MLSIGIQLRPVFEDIDSFNNYYQLNKNKMRAMTTQRLNTLFSVPGYKIVKRDGVITLKSNTKTNLYLSDRVTALESQVQWLAQRPVDLLQIPSDVH
jgi:hypothetical protein